MFSISFKKFRISHLLLACGALVGSPVVTSLAQDSMQTDGQCPPGYYRTYKEKRRPRYGYQGFGIQWRLGYGYGGKACGVGQDGGYPYYGGTGYPGPEPQLKRLPLCSIVPFPYNGNPGGPTPECPHYFGIPGPLSPTEQVITFESDQNTPAFFSDYGVFSGTIPYPESAFAPAGAGPVDLPRPSPAEGPETPTELEPTPAPKESK